MMDSFWKDFQNLQDIPKVCPASIWCEFGRWPLGLSKRRKSSGYANVKAAWLPANFRPGPWRFSWSGGDADPLQKCQNDTGHAGARSTSGTAGRRVVPLAMAGYS